MFDTYPNTGSATTYLAAEEPDVPVFFFRPDVLRATLNRFRRGFPGLVTYAVKANPGAEVLATLAEAGLETFDVASPAEMRAVRAAAPNAALHYNNPVRSTAEIAEAKRLGVMSWSVDRPCEFDKLGDLPPGTEISVRIHLAIPGAAYDFGSKFGATPDVAAGLLRSVAERGLRPSITFHPGTQCADGAAWAAYIHAAADLAGKAGVTLSRLNVGGGFAAHRSGPAPDLETIFAAISRAVAEAFGREAPALVCEPGRAMVAEAVTLALRVKSAEPGRITLNDGIYGALAEWRDLGVPDRLTVVSPDGVERTGARAPRTVFGPTCDSLDVLPTPVGLPANLQDGDYLICPGMGAYSGAIATAFNGYAERRVVTVGS